MRAIWALNQSTKKEFKGNEHAYCVVLKTLHLAKLANQFKNNQELLRDRPIFLSYQI